MKEWLKERLKEKRERLKKKQTELKALFAAWVAVFWTALPAMADTSKGTEFQTLYDKLLNYVQGLPGIMFALGILLFGIYRSFFAGAGPLYFFGSAIAAAAIFVVPNIAANAGGATF
jgi:hypothetical protein